MMKNGRPSGLVIGLLVLAALAFFAFRGCSGLIPGTGSSGTRGQAGGDVMAGGELGQMFVASEVDQRGCPLNQETRYLPGDAIFVGTEPSDIPAGTAIFARLLQGGQPVEDAQEITADQDLNNTCVWFEFAATRQSQGLEPGNYSAELIVNGNRVDSVQFVVDEGRGGLAGGGVAEPELGQFVATSRVDSRGCPTNEVGEFFTDENVMVAMTESNIPAGTDIFARMVQDGQPVEDTDIITADQDMENSCVWFEFESENSQGFDPGAYEVQLVVNGSITERVQFDVVR